MEACGVRAVMQKVGSSERRAQRASITDRTLIVGESPSEDNGVRTTEGNRPAQRRCRREHRPANLVSHDAPQRDKGAPRLIIARGVADASLRLVRARLAFNHRSSGDAGSSEQWGGAKSRANNKRRAYD